MYCIYSTCIVYTVNVLYIQYIYCIYSTCTAYTLLVLGLIMQLLGLIMQYSPIKPNDSQLRYQTQAGFDLCSTRVWYCFICLSNPLMLQPGNKQNLVFFMESPFWCQFWLSKKSKYVIYHECLDLNLKSMDLLWKTLI